MKKSRFLSLVLALLMLLSLAACGEAPAEETPAEEAPAEETPAEEAPAEEAPAEAAPAPDPEWGRSVPEADGIMEYEALKAASEELSGLTGKEGGYQRPLYEEVMEIFGVHGMKSEGHWSDEYHAYFWLTADESAKCLISFKVQPDGSETWASTSFSDNN